METNQGGQAERFFKEFGKRVDLFLVDLKDAGQRAEKDFQEKFEELKESAERLKKEAENKERWKEVEESLKKAGKEMENAFKSAFKKKEN
jgi:pyruvate-formate lyase-activating enzyme